MSKQDLDSALSSIRASMTESRAVSVEFLKSIVVYFKHCWYKHFLSFSVNFIVIKNECVWLIYSTVVFPVFLVC